MPHSRKASATFRRFLRFWGCGICSVNSATDGDFSVAGASLFLSAAGPAGAVVFYQLLHCLSAVPRFAWRFLREFVSDVVAIGDASAAPSSAEALLCAADLFRFLRFAHDQACNAGSMPSFSAEGAGHARAGSGSSRSGIIFAAAALRVSHAEGRLLLLGRRCCR